MPCIDMKPAWRRRALRVAGPWLLLALAGCATPPPPAQPSLSPPATAPAPAAPAAVPPVAPAAPAAPAPRYIKLPPPPASRSWDELRLTAARRLVAAHPDTSYMGQPPEPLLGIPVLEVELNADGSVRSIKVVREPREAKETIQMAIDAVHRAAPYGDVSRLPRPWRFVEVFLFDDDHRFKPATLDR